MKKWVVLVLGCLGWGSAIMSVPQGWSALTEDVWASPSQVCQLKEKHHNQAFNKITNMQTAVALSSNLAQALKQQYQEVQAEIISRPEQYMLSFGYTLLANGVSYQIYQNYLSEEGKLRTITVSIPLNNSDFCLLESRLWLREAAF